MKLSNLATLLLDILILNLSYIISYYIRFSGNFPLYNFDPYLYLWPLLSLTALVLFNIYGLYDTARKTWIETFYSLVCAVGLIFLSGTALVYFTGGFSFPRSVFLISALLQIILLGIFRFAVWKMEKSRNGISDVIIIGSITEANGFAGKMHSDSLGIYKIMGFIVNNIDDCHFTDEKVIGTVHQAIELLSEYAPDEVIIGSSVAYEEKKQIIKFCIERGKAVLLVPDIYEIMLSEVDDIQVDDKMLFKIQGLDTPVGQRFIKRFFDIIFSLIGIMGFWIIGVVVAIFIKIDSNGPIFYTQERVSRNGKIFKLIKFRTMIVNAESESGPILAVKDDARITRLGHFLRLTRIDEIPQLFNVLGGDMSLVGPRPERPHFVQKYNQNIPGYSYREKVMPGITGWAQVAGKYSTTPDDKLKYDLLYAKRHSLLFDIKILLHTIRVVLIKNKAV